LGEIKKVVMLFSMSFLPHQGRYLRVYNEAKTLVDAGKEVTIIAWDRDCREPREEEINGIKVERIWSKAGFQQGPSNLFNFLRFYIRLFRQLRKKDFDLIHCFNLDTLLPGWIMARLRGKKAILDLCEPNYYTNWPRKYAMLVRWIQVLERFFSRRFDYVLVHNLYQVRKFQGYGIKHLEQIGSYPNRSLIIDGIGKRERPDNRVVIGRIGSIYRNNGIEEMIEAYQRLVKEYPQVRLLLAGKVFKEYEEEFKELISPCAHSIEIIGEFHPRELPQLYGRIDVSLQLSRRTEWFRPITPTKFFESLANGVPVITSDIGDLREIIEEYDCGLIVDETSPESVYQGLKRLVEDPSLRTRMAENGLRAIKERYNWDLMAQRLLKIYHYLES